MRLTCMVCGDILIEIEKRDNICSPCSVAVSKVIERGIKDWSDVDTHTMRAIVDRVRTLLDSSLDVIETLVMYHDNDPLIYMTLNLDVVGAIKVTVRSDQILSLANTLA